LQHVKCVWIPILVCTYVSLPCFVCRSVDSQRQVDENERLQFVGSMKENNLYREEQVKTLLTNQKEVHRLCNLIVVERKASAYLQVFVQVPYAQHTVHDTYVHMYICMNECILVCINAVRRASAIMILASRTAYTSYRHRRTYDYRKQTACNLQT
jgi:hypothetical protein